MTTNMELIGRDEINDLEAILSVCNTDASAILRAVKTNADAVFTWDYERSRTPLIKLYEKAKTSQWNVTTDLDFFRLIVPCGIADRGVTSLALATGSQPPIEEVETRFVDRFADVFSRLTPLQSVS